MTESEVSRRLAREPVPGEDEAADRAWEIIRAAFATRDRVPRPTHRWRAVLVVALLAALVVAAVTPPGRAVVEKIREAVGTNTSEPTLVRLPAQGRLLVLSDQGPWVVRQDGLKRFLGDYTDASWSPRGRYVVAAQDNQLVALDPESGDVRWKLPRPAVRDPRWSGGGLDTRIAYRAGDSLHVVAGDGSPDAVLAPKVAPVAPAWKPDSHVLAFAGIDGRVHVVDVDSGRELSRTPRIDGIRRLGFSGRLLVVLTGRNARLYGPHRLIRLAASPALPKGHVLLDATPLPGGRVLYADYDPAADATSIVLASCFAPGPCLLIGPSRVFQGPGRIGTFTLSPDGHWLVAGWPESDQFLFFNTRRLNKVVFVPNVTREFAPGGATGGPFPRIAGWAPAAP
jgi:hypothetical protein